MKLMKPSLLSDPSPNIIGDLHEQDNNVKAKSGVVPLCLFLSLSVFWFRMLEGIKTNEY